MAANTEAARPGSPGENVADLVTAAARRRSLAEGVVDTASGATLTWIDVDNATTAFARRIRDAGVRPGDRVALRLPTCAELVVGLLAVFRSGAIAVPLSPTAPDAEVCDLITDCGARLLIAHDDLGDVPALVPDLDHSDAPSDHASEVGGSQDGGSADGTSQEHVSSDGGPGLSDPGLSDPGTSGPGMSGPGTGFPRTTCPRMTGLGVTGLGTAGPRTARPRTTARRVAHRMTARRPTKWGQVARTSPRSSTPRARAAPHVA